MSDDEIRKAYFRERVEAASADASKFIKLIAQGHDFDDGAVHEKSPFEIAFADTFFGKTKLIDLLDGNSRNSEAFKACSHISLAHPSVMFVPLCTPTILACAMCVLEYQNDWNSQHPSDCDSCYEYADGFYEISIPVGPLIIVGNVCEDCIESHRRSMGL